MLITITGGLLAAAETSGDDSSNLALGLLIGAVGLVGGVWWIVYRFRAARRPAASRAEHEMLREITAERPEQRAVQRVRPRVRLRRSGF
ncbi:MAG: hypothetical protein ACTHWW_09175 [Arthrobacter sp.]|uniref:hypothetical protein n=1 Tax=unclassified Arthrobacter TaxID=235627 RepID=UPI00264E5BB2|nr:hypothetical protein [Micrococcaceae bacterium]MDN5824892.1 hypothetical protein [Micrococcaceae bacterium]MDN5880158.1 hypothetical protein [Micrococcaceae bacterium]MDN5887566.1 hypothetical protein [Micrococcaceae bacterium]MDN5906430.1 hypothetical protein [Micrococcaceae bacterium]